MRKGGAEWAVRSCWPQSSACAPVPLVTGAARVHSKESIKAGWILKFDFGPSWSLVLESLFS